MTYEDLVAGGARVGTVTVTLKWTERPGLGTGTALLACLVEDAVRAYLNGDGAKERLGVSMAQFEGAIIEADMLGADIAVDSDA